MRAPVSATSEIAAFRLFQRTCFGAEHRHRSDDGVAAKRSDIVPCIALDMNIIGQQAGGDVQPGDLLSTVCLRPCNAQSKAVCNVSLGLTEAT